MLLAPVQVKLIPITDRNLEYMKEVKEKLEAKGIRCEIDDRDEKLGYKIRESQTKKIPYTLVLGDNEVNNDMITYRKHGEKDSVTVSVDEFIELINMEITTKGVK